MNRKKMIKAALVWGLFFIALGGWLLHHRIHPLNKGAVYYIPFIVGLVSVFVVPILFWFDKTIHLAYIINGFSAIIGTITMAHFSIVNFEGRLNPLSILTNTLFADIALLWAKFALGKALFGLKLLKSENDTVPRGYFLRYPNMGWWWIHLFALACVYALGNIFWK